MKRPITVKFEDQILMFTVDIQRKDDNIVYHLENDSSLEKFSKDLPANFDLIKAGDSDNCTFSEQPLTERGTALAQAICKVMAAHPPQFKGEEKETAKAF